MVISITACAGFIKLVNKKKPLINALGTTAFHFLKLKLIFIF